MSEQEGFDFSDDESARESMKTFIRENFEEHLEGLDDIFEQPNWYKRLAETLEEKIQNSARELPENIRKLRRMLERYE